MDLKPVTVDSRVVPEKIQPYIKGARLFDSSCQNARTLFVDRGKGYFLKIAPKGALADDALMTAYFHRKGRSARVCEYISEAQDFLITERIPGQDGLAQKHLDNPEKLCDVFASSLRALHEADFSDCPKTGRTSSLAEAAQQHYLAGTCTNRLLKFSDVKTLEEGWHLLNELLPLAKDDALLHGDYCLPNILLDDFRFSGFIDVGYGGVGDRHFDLFWGLWTLQHNFHSDIYKDRFLDVYGRDKVDPARLKLWGLLAALTD